MEIVFISDTHGKHEELQLPDGDMIVHAGDLSPRGRPDELQAFLDWFSALPYQHKVFIGGNHDFMLERKRKQFLQMVPDNCIYLLNEGATIAGIRIWGSPVTPWFFDWAFNRRRGSDIRRYWERIPTETELLITHGPPFGILDKTARGDHAGCEDLVEIVQQIQPRIHVFGHIHEAQGKFQDANTLFINASVLNLQYQLAHKPVHFRWE